MSSDSDNDFSPTESTDNSDGDKFLNKKTGEYVPSMVTKTLLTTGIAVGFVIGLVITAAVVSAGMCMFQIITVFTSDPTSASTGDNFADSIESDVTTCTKTSMLTPIPMVLGVIGGVVTAYPAYRLVKSLSSGNYLRSII